MKKFLLTIVISICCYWSYSQTLSNTTWGIYDTTSTLLAYFHFSADTLSFSSDNISYTNISTFQESGNNFTIVDLSNTQSCLYDTGRYTFLFSYDTLKFTLISDSCSGRPETFTDFYWTQLILTGVQSVNKLPLLKIYPNPFNQTSCINFNYAGGVYYLEVYDMFGNRVKRIENITSDKIVFERGNLTKGFYFIELRSEKETLKGKIVVE